MAQQGIKEEQNVEVIAFLLDTWTPGHQRSIASERKWLGVDLLGSNDEEGNLLR
jgi:hypothetical protein